MTIEVVNFQQNIMLCVGYVVNLIIGTYNIDFIEYLYLSTCKRYKYEKVLNTFYFQID